MWGGKIFRLAEKVVTVDQNNWWPLLKQAFYIRYDSARLDGSACGQRWATLDLLGFTLLGFPALRGFGDKEHQDDQRPESPSYELAGCTQCTSSKWLSHIVITRLFFLGAHDRQPTIPLSREPLRRDCIG